MLHIRLKSTILFAFSLFIIISGCDVFSSDDKDGAGTITLSGQLLNNATNNPVTEGFIRVLPFDLLFEADDEGFFSFEVEIDSTMELQVTASSDGFGSQTFTVLALADRIIDVPIFHLIPLIAERATSGQASNMILLSQSHSSIGVRESGSEELASMTFLLADSIGNPVILDQSADVRFRFGVQPGGGEFISPTSTPTDNNGEVTVFLSSGTRAGVVQIIAETTVEGRLIRSQPVAVTIHGGLPDQTHFTLGPQRRNFPGLNTFGLINPMSVILGDQYSYPVRIGSAVYFETTHGVIEGSVLTDDQGQGTVNLISANPLPGDGIAHIVARTANDQQEIVSDIIPVIFSGTPVMTVTPSTAIINQFYTFTVTDYNGNPLVQGTNITVAIGGSAVKVTGTTNRVLDDSAFSGGIDYVHVVRGPGITEFSFVVSEDIDPLDPQTPELDAISISTSGGNGSLEIVLSGVGEPFSDTDGVSRLRMADGSYRFEFSGSRF